MEAGDRVPDTSTDSIRSYYCLAVLVLGASHQSFAGPFIRCQSPLAAKVVINPCRRLPCHALISPLVVCTRMEAAGGFGTQKQKRVEQTLNDALLRCRGPLLSCRRG